MIKLLTRPGIVSDVIKVLTGNIVAQGCAFLANVVVSRDLGPASYGRFALIIAIFTCITQLSDFGTSTSYVRFLARNKEVQAEAFGSLVLFKIMTSAALAALIWMCADVISQYFFDNSNYRSMFQMVAVALVFHSLLTTMIAHLQGMEKFRRYSLLSIAHHGFRLVSTVVILLVADKESHFNYFMYAYFFVAAVIVIILLLRWHMVFRINWDYIRQIYSLGFWIFLSSVAVIVQMRIDVLMLQKLGNPVQTGLYSAASSVAMIFPLITMSITATMMPKMDSFLRDHTVRQFIAKTGKLTKYVLFSCVLLEIVSPLLIRILFGEAYKHAIPVFGILLVSYMFGIVINPISLIYYQVNRAYVLTLVNWGQLLIGYFCNLVLIPPYGANGAAVSSLLLHIFSSAVIVGYLYVVQPSLPGSVPNLLKTK